MIFTASCPHCSQPHVVPVTAIGDTVECPKCGEEHPVHPKAATAVEGLLAALLESGREQTKSLLRLETAMFSLRLAITLLLGCVLLFGVRVSLK